MTGKIRKSTGYLDLTTYSRKFIREGHRYWFDQRRPEIEIHGPATNICVRWVGNENPAEPLEITADISPAFRSCNIKDNIQMDWIQHDYFREALFDQGSFLIIPTSFKCDRDGLCFNVAHTETEGKLVKDLSLVHNRSYKLLKCIVNGGNMDSIERPTDPLKLQAFLFIDREIGIQALECFSSFSLKTVILLHSRNCLEKSDISKCITDCLKHIREKIFLAQDQPGGYVWIDVFNVFNARQRVIGQKIRKEVVLTNCLKALDDVLKILIEVSRMCSLSLSLCKLTNRFL